MAPATSFARARWSAGVTKGHVGENDIMFMRTLYEFGLEMQARKMATPSSKQFL
jgi:hypothetical protein